MRHGSPGKEVPVVKNLITAVLFDFGGVLAEEGFYEGLLAIARKQGRVPGAFFKAVDALIYQTGYLVGAVDEAAFWNAVRAATGITGGDQELRQEIISRFILRPGMLSVVDKLRARGLVVAMLSDQTDWLEELDRGTGLFRHFERVFNSFRLRKSKRDESVFVDVCAALGVKTGETLFIDDNEGHIRRAESQGLRTIHFTGVDGFVKQLEILLPGTGRIGRDTAEKG
jgi:putative hydrolase of the HAD superfamily